MSVRTDSEFEDAAEAAPDNQSSDGACISKDDAFHVLQNARRRAVLRYLSEHEETDTFVMRDIAEEVAAWEHDTTVQRLVSDERQRVYIALYQSHLPKLDEHGIIEYNQSRGIVEPTELTAAFEPYLDDGLHADSELAVPAEPAERAERDDESSLTTAVSSLFKR
jgi:hypothetical protein